VRRIYILFYWFFIKKRNGVKLVDIIQFLLKPKVRTIGARYIKSIDEDDHFYKVQFKEVNAILYWPKCYTIDGMYQVSAETFDKDDWHNYQAIFKVESSEVLLDIGAAEGLFALSVAGLCEKIILIEPNSNFISALRKSFSTMPDKVEILEFAVGSKTGYTNFSEESLSGKISDAHLLAKQVAMKKIDDIISDDIKITFFKADIEGFELDMLKGAEHTIKRNKPKIVVTTYHKENNADEIIALIKSYVPEYKFLKRGIFHDRGKPVTVHFWVN
jgi:FkbM family methyltransferase